MSETKHTPGPWEVQEPEEGFGSMRIWSQNWGFITSMCGGSADEANARLMSAAPDLLAALKAALLESGCDGDLCARAWHEDARAAIAKAEEPRS